jgi:ParB family chromosome partitioning protein
MELKQIDIDRIKPNPFQPRMKFDKEELQELADNIEKHGMIEPIVVTEKGDNYLIVAGERRWRANKLAKKEKVYAIIKHYDSEVDIKRDSLIENEMRENLSNEEFRTFVISLAKSLGEPYYNKGFVNPIELSKYIVAGESATRSPFHNKLLEFFKIQQSASAKVKKLFEEDKINRTTAARIAAIPDKQVQDEMADLAKHKSQKEIRKEVTRHNFEQQVKETKAKVKAESNEEKNFKSEMIIVSKFENKLNSWCDGIEFLSKHIQDNRNILSKFSDKSRREMMDALKPVKVSLEKALHLVTKFMEELAK